MPLQEEPHRFPQAEPPHEAQDEFASRASQPRDIAGGSRWVFNTIESAKVRKNSVERASIIDLREILNGSNLPGYHG